MARKPADPNKPVRKQGPRTLYMVFPEGTAPEILAAAKSAKLTFNGRKFLESLAGGEAPAPFVMFKIDVAAKGDAGEAAS